MKSLKWFVLALIIFSFPSYAKTLIFHGNSKVEISNAELEALPETTIHTELPWIKRKAKFTGITFEALFDFVDEEMPDNIYLTALNDYKVSISKEDIKNFQPIVAYAKDDQKMSVREKGPYWVIFSLSQYPELDVPDYHSKMIWQLKSIGTFDEL